MTCKTTKDDFLFFKNQCNYWLNVLGLISWKIYYEWVDCKENLADTSTDFTANCATIRLNKKWTIEVTTDMLDECALHEVIEVLMSPLFGHAQARTWDIDDYEKEHHRIIRTFTHLLMKDKKCPTNTRP